MDGGALAVSPSGTVAAIWRRDHDIYLSDGPTSTERRLGEGIQPWLATDKQRLYAVWLTGPSGKLFFAKSPTFDAAELSDGARFPVVAARSAGKGRVAVAWESSGKLQSLIRIATMDRQ